MEHMPLLSSEQIRAQITRNREEKKRQQKERRRATCRRNQQRYRDRQKQKEQQLVAQVEGLRHRINTLLMYQGLVAQGQVLCPSNRIQKRYLMLELYAKYFEYGVDRRNIDSFMTQERFLRCNAVDAMILESVEQPRGPDVLLKQWELTTQVHTSAC